MSNGTANLSMPGSFFRRYFLGESINNILLRLTIILSAIILVWCGIMLALIIHTKCQRRKQLQKTSTSHHLYDSSTSLTNRRSTRSKRNRRFQSSRNSLTSARCYSIRRLLSQFKAHCFFWPSSTERRNANSTDQISAVNRRDEALLTSSSRSTSNKVQLVVEAMTRHPRTSKHRLFHPRKKGSLYRETDSSSGDDSRNPYAFERDQPIPVETKRGTCNVVDTTQLLVSRLE